MKIWARDSQRKYGGVKPEFWYFTFSTLMLKLLGSCKLVIVVK
jgi:hypothetical protein